MRIKLLLCLVLLGFVGGCSKKTQLDLDEDENRLAKLPALTSTAIVLRGPMWLVGVGVLMLGVRGFRVKINTRIKQSRVLREGEEESGL